MSKSSVSAMRSQEKEGGWNFGKRPRGVGRGREGVRVVEREQEVRREGVVVRKQKRKKKRKRTLHQ